jgi:hypothetical protein
VTIAPKLTSEFTVIAIIAGYNEADIIGHVVGSLIEQGIRVYFLDDGSTDGTVDIVSSFLGHGMLAVEHLSDTLKDVQPGRFRWEQILSRKAQLATEIDAHWVLHHDADEFRESPWPNLSLNAAIKKVDRLGFNAIDFQCLDFWPVHDGFRPGEDVREALTFYAAAASHDRLQIKCWKKTSLPVDLTSSGGHEVSFPGRLVFPVRFLLRHYPIRGQAHGERKVFAERRLRFVDSERAKGWHVQYDGVQQGQSFIKDPSTLTRYDPDDVRISLALRHRGVEEIEEAVRIHLKEADSLRSELSERGADLQRQDAQLGHAQEELTRSREEVTRTHAELTRTSDELLAARRELQSVHQALVESNGERMRLRSTVDQLGAEVGHREAELRRLQEDVADTVRKVEELMNSRTWRWTAPVRATIDAVSRKSRKS